MNMQDKEFDDLFRTKLDGLEVEPSAQVWGSIDAELNGKRDRKGILPFMRIAASIIVLVTAGIVFIARNTNDKPSHHPQNFANMQPAAVAPTANDNPVNAPTTPGQEVAAIKVSVNHIAKALPAKKVVIAETPKQPDATAIANIEPARVTEQQVLAVVPNKTNEPSNGVVPGPETPLNIKTSGGEVSPAIKRNSDMEAAQAVITKSVVKKRGIHNMGDLVNIVVAKLDRRKNKVIEFTDTDDESTITAVNMGPLKIKREDK